MNMRIVSTLYRRSFSTSSSSSTSTSTTWTPSPLVSYGHPVSRGCFATTRRLMFLGAPGVGKGTYAQRLACVLSVPHVSAGELIREEIRHQTPLGLEIRDLTRSGHLVGDAIVTKLVRKRLSQDDAMHGYILDGYPRTLVQADHLEEFSSLEAVLLLQQREDIIVTKLSGRRTCSNCGTIYNFAEIKEHGLHMPPILPRVANICDSCGAKDSLVQRDDDKIEVIRDRLHTYENQTAPLISHYVAQNKLFSFEVMGGVEDLFPRFKDFFVPS